MRKQGDSLCVVEDEATAFYVDVLRRLSHASIPFLVGGAFAYMRYAGIQRETKDLDIFMRRDDIATAFRILEVAGYETALPFPHWLGKASRGERFVDLIFGSGNGLSRVDDLWFDYAPEDTMFGVLIRLCPPEEMIWSKAFVQERERFDGADLMHLLRAQAPTLDWQRLLRRFGEHWRVLLSHIILFDFVYPHLRGSVPGWVIDELTSRFTRERAASVERICYGTLLSRAQYRFDIEQLRYVDVRLIAQETGLTPKEIESWTAAVEDDDRERES